VEPLLGRAIEEREQVLLITRERLDGLRVLGGELVVEALDLLSPASRVGGFMISFSAAFAFG
jgi:hypothetical protein